MKLRDLLYFFYWKFFIEVNVNDIFFSFINVFIILTPMSEFPPKINTFFIYLKYCELTSPIKVPSTSQTLHG